MSLFRWNHAHCDTSMKLGTVVVHDETKNLSRRVPPQVLPYMVLKDLLCPNMVNFVLACNGLLTCRAI